MVSVESRCTSYVVEVSFENIVRGRFNVRFYDRWSKKVFVEEVNIGSVQLYTILDASLKFTENFNNFEKNLINNFVNYCENRGV